MPTPKRFTRPKQPKQADLPFTVEFDVDGEPVDHSFNAQPKFSYGDMVGLNVHKDDADRVLPILDRIIRRALRNNDGVPVKWKPKVDNGEFTNPDGNLCPIADLEKYTAHEAGSSRRRWIELIESDDAFVDFDQVMSVFEYLTAEAAKRPTKRS